MTISTTMRALRQTTLDGPQDLRLIDDVPVPTPGRGEVLIRVGAAGVNFADVMQTHGTYGGGPQAPYLAGFEAAGTVVALGPGVTSRTIGDRVIGAGPGAFAEYMLMPASATLPVPAGWADEQALGLVLNWATALAALKPLGRLTEGETVLVTAAAGGVGQAAVTMAKHYGATVIATASPSKHDTVRALSADHVLDHRAADIASEVRRLTGDVGADLVLESVGGNTFGASLTAARRITGRVVVYGNAAGAAALTTHKLVFEQQVQVIGLHIGVLAEAAPQLFAGLMAELDALISAGVYRPGRPTVFDLADGPRILARMQNGLTVGKLALRP
ncbi:NADPH:quinone oxidoreductase family protein [Actinoplanes sp. NPDC020271]|uniref:NADPH:quinone oxidoreductase family protein n=1 Tax=Actinoplanes sp. NPDC020271 TaxID=3363896 RepID=UPI0037A87407